MPSSVGSKRTVIMAVAIVLIIVITGIAWYFIQSGRGSVEFPTKPITMIVGWAAGGASDVICRALALGMQEYFKVPIAVNNIAGANGAVGAAEVLKTPPDGHTLFCGALTAAARWRPSGASNISWVDFYNVITVTQYSAIAVKSNAPWRDLNDLLHYIKANPGKVKIGHTGVGSANHLLTTLILKAAGIPLDHVIFIPYSGGREVGVKLLAGEIDVGGFSWGDLTDYIVAGEIRSIVTDTPGGIKRFNIPSVSEFFPELEKYVGLLNVYWGVGIPRNVPDYVVKRIVEAVKYAMNTEQFKNITTTREFIVEFIAGVESDKVLSKIESLASWLMYELGITKIDPSTLGIPRFEEWRWPPYEAVAKARQWPGLS